MIAHRKEQSQKRMTISQAEEHKSGRPDLKFTVILPKPQKHALLIMPPQEAKVVRQLSPREKHMIKLYEKRERLKAIKNKQALSKSLVRAGVTQDHLVIS